MATKTFDATPSASMLVESLRDIGYSLETALADIIDNSITAQAENIELFADISDADHRIGIVDDGTGMSEQVLHDAMRPGSGNPLDIRPRSDLGRFGLGLKIASFSQCRRLTVATRHEGITSAAIWDLDFVAERNKWLVQIPEQLAAIPWISHLGESGTLVIWEKLDRLVEPATSGDMLPYITRRIDETREHLELVFHRFLTGERGLKKVHLSLNGRQLVPFDPFHIDHAATICGPVEKIRVTGQEVVMQAFTLPHHQKVTPAEWERFAGRAGYLKNQGFYVYREKRLIIHGTWFGLARQMELTKLARVRIDIPNGLDAQWKIDVKKSTAQPPYRVRERLRRIIEEIGLNSKRVYTARGRKLTADNRLPVWNRIQDKNEITYRINSEHPVIVDFISKLPEELKRDFSHVLEITGSALPMDALFADMGGAPEKVSGNLPTDDALQYAVKTTAKRLIDMGGNREEIPDMLKLAEPFRSNWKRTEEILAETLSVEVSGE